METTKLKTVDYTYNGRAYRLCCNMNVVAAVQDAYDGNLLRALDQRGGLRSTQTFLAAMLTEAADTQSVKDADGLPLQITAKEIGRELTWRETLDAGKLIWPLIDDAVRSITAEPSEDEKN